MHDCLGPRYVSAPPFSLRDSYRDSDCCGQTLAWNREPSEAAELLGLGWGGGGEGL